MPVKLVMLGLSHSHSHGNAKAAGAEAGVTLVGVHDPDTRLAWRRCAEWSEFLPHLHIFADADEALGAEGVEGVVVDGRVRENLAFARLALEHGKHVLLEKPAGVDLAQFRRLHELAGERGLLIQMGYILRYNAGYETARRLVDARALGDIFFIRSRMSWEVGSYDGQMPEIADLPGGMLCELGCHGLDLIMGLLGKPMRAQAHVASHHDPAARHTDNALAVLEYERAFATIETCGMESGAFQNRTFEVYGTGGTLMVRPLEPPSVALHLEAPWEEFQAGWQTPPVPALPRHVRDLREFAACIRGEKAPDYPPEHDLAVQETLLGMCGEG